MSSVVTVAVDIGSGVTKAKSQAASAEFPSLSGPPLPEVFSLTREPGAYVSFGGKDFCVGERALSAVRPSDIVDSRTDGWHETDGYRALLYAALARVLPPGYAGRVALATGLPIGLYRDAKEALLGRLVGEHRFTAGGAAYKLLVRKPDLYILPQALGLYLRHLELAPEAHEGRCGFVDIGTYTSGFLQTENFALLQYATGSARIGVGDIKSGLADYLSATYRMHVTRSTVEAALATGRMRVGTEWVDLREAIENIAMTCSEPLRLALRGSWGAAKECSIFVGGGGGRLLYPAIRTAFPHATLLETKAPHLAVVEGFFNYAKTKSKSRVAASVA